MAEGSESGEMMAGSSIAIIVLFTFILIILIGGGCYAGYREYISHHHNGQTHLHRVQSNESLSASSAALMKLNPEGHTLREAKREEPGQVFSRHPMGSKKI